MIEKPRRLRPGKLQPPHVGDVEEACRAPHGVMLGDNRTVLDGHLPAGKIHHASAMRHMPVVTGGVEKLTHLLTLRIWRDECDSQIQKTKSECLRKDKRQNSKTRPACHPTARCILTNIPQAVQPYDRPWYS